MLLNECFVQNDYIISMHHNIMYFLFFGEKNIRYVSYFEAIPMMYIIDKYDIILMFYILFYYLTLIKGAYLMLKGGNFGKKSKTISIKLFNMVFILHEQNHVYIIKLN